MQHASHTPMPARQVAAMLTYAIDLAQAYPTATALALADKLLTVWPGSDRLLRFDVATTAMTTVDVARAAASRTFTVEVWDREDQLFNVEAPDGHVVSSEHETADSAWRAATAHLLHA